MYFLALGQKGTVLFRRAKRPAQTRHSPPMGHHRTGVHSAACVLLSYFHSFEKIRGSPHTPVWEVPNF